MTQNNHSQSLDEPALSPIKFLPREQCNLIRPSTHELENSLSRIKGKHRKEIANEIRMMFNSYLMNGYFKFDTDRLIHTYGQYFLRQLRKAIRPFTKVIKDAGRKKCCHRVFLLTGIQSPPFECTTDSALNRFNLYPINHSLTYRTIPSDFLTHRYNKWCEYCRKNNLPNHVDFDGETPWGAVLLETQRSLLVPFAAPVPNDSRELNPEESEAFQQHVQKRLNSYQRGVCNVAIRRHGRVYTPTTGLPIELREQILIDGEKTNELDLHATYWTLVIKMMPEGEEKETLKRVVASPAGFYSIFDFSVLPTHITPKNSKLKSKVNPKVEVMKQCLFLNSNEAMPPLRQQLKSKFPQFDSFICDLRAEHGPTGLSHILTGLEGRVFVDMIIPKLGRLNCKPNSNHDGIIVPVSQTEIAMQLMINTLAKFLGFRPKLKLKNSPNAKSKTA